MCVHCVCGRRGKRSSMTRDISICTIYTEKSCYQPSLCVLSQVQNHKINYQQFCFILYLRIIFFSTPLKLRDIFSFWRHFEGAAVWLSWMLKDEWWKSMFRCFCWMLWNIEHWSKTLSNETLRKQRVDENIETLVKHS